MLGIFFGARARHLENLFRLHDAEPDYLVARYLFPQNRWLYIAQNLISVQVSMSLFEPGEKGHPVELAEWLQEVVSVAPWIEEPPDQSTQDEREPTDGKDSHFHGIFSSGETVPHRAHVGPSRRR